MLSILIPSYNYNVVALAKILHKQCNSCHINYEILVYDDGSKSYHNLQNANINNIENCTFKELASNIGRSQIRNKLAKDSKFEHLLFLDCDVLPEHPTLIENYIHHISSDVVYGGITNEKEIPKKPYKLRWLYTKKREYKFMCSSNFFIKKEVMLKDLFDETIRKYGYEDVIFFKNLENNAITITPIKNSVIHFSKEKSKVYIKKIEIGLENLSYLSSTNKIALNDSKIYYYYNMFSKFYLVNFIAFCFKATKKLMLKNFDSSSPSLFLFDFYRLGFFCTIKSKK